MSKVMAECKFLFNECHPRSESESCYLVPVLLNLLSALLMFRWINGRNGCLSAQRNRIDSSLAQQKILVKSWRASPCNFVVQVGYHVINMYKNQANRYLSALCTFGSDSSLITLVSKHCPQVEHSSPMSSLCRQKFHKEKNILYFFVISRSRLNALVPFGLKSTLKTTGRCWCASATL